MTTLVEWAGRWKRTNAKVADGTFSREDWIAHLRADSELAKKEPKFDLEAILVLGMKLGFIQSPDEAAALL